jgi:hypothetical protein
MKFISPLLLLIKRHNFIGNLGFEDILVPQ